MLRRQMIRPMRRPLIVFTPKSLLRHPLAVSSMEDLAMGRFQNVIGEIDPLDAESVSRVVMCSGKVYYDLLDARRKGGLKQTVIVRIEQLYPFPHAELAEVFTSTIRYTIKPTTSKSAYNITIGNSSYNFV